MKKSKKEKKEKDPKVEQDSNGNSKLNNNNSTAETKQEDGPPKVKQSGTLHSSFGNVDLFYQKWESPNLERETKRVLAIIHGFGDHSGNYTSIVNHFVPLHFTVYGGHGKSSSTKKGHVTWQELSHDLNKFLKFLQEFEAGKDLFIFSTSAAGILLLNFLLHNPSMAYSIKGVIVSGLALEYKNFPSWMKGVLKASALVLPHMSIDTNITLDQLTTDKEVIDQTKNEPYMNVAATPKLFSEIMKAGMQYDTICAHIEASWVASHAADVRFPLLVLQGGDDTVVSKDANVRFYKDVTLEDKQMYTYPGMECYHFDFIIQGARHEPFNDTCKEIVLDHMERWMKDHMNLNTTSNELAFLELTMFHSQT